MENNILLESTIESLHVVEKTIDEFSEKFKIADELYGNILIAVLEFVKNAIIHGNKKNPNKKVELIMKIENNKLVVTTTDQGSGFDFNNLPDPTAPENILKTKGRGVFLMRKLSDQANFHDEGRVSQLIFNLTYK
jgi:serine/threonine-protein kinase RsbW